MWGCGREGCLFLHPRRKFCSPLLPRGGAGSSAVSVLSQHPRAEGAAEVHPVPPTDNPMPSAGPQATPSHFSLIPTLLAWRKDKPCVETVACPSSQLGLFLQGFWCPQGHTALSGNYASGQLSLAFLSSESCVFLPLFGGGSVAGQPSRASLQREAQPSSLALLTGAGLSSCP